MKQLTLSSLFIVSAVYVFSMYSSLSCSSSESGKSSVPSVSTKSGEGTAGKAFANESFKTVFADIAAKVTPSVVSVLLTKIDTVTYMQNPFYNFFSDSFFNSPFDFFFNQPQQPRRKKQPERREFRQEHALGSGVIVSQDGYILTNYHVVSGADEIKVKLSDERSFEAKIIGTDSLSDVAVIKIKEKVSQLPVADLGESSKLRPGDWALAIGNPFSLTSTVTLGIISALGREVGSTLYQNYIQTDAAINPGNSGGALVNIDGQVIGINTMIFTETGGFMGIGFAVPIDMARKVMDDLIRTGKVSRGWIGVSIQNLNQATRDALDLKEKGGVLIGDVYKGQPADKAGIRRGDVILSIADKAVGSANALKNIVADLSPGKTYPVVVFRNGKQLSLSITIVERNEKEIARLASAKGRQPEGGAVEKEKRLGLSVTDITDDIRKKYGLTPGEKGIAIVSVDPRVTDAREGLKEGDVIQQIKVKNTDFQPVASVKEFDQIIEKIHKGDPVMLLVLREATTFFIGFTVE
ncbi:MAG TPA: Do family serine endopeptidase [Chitinivibrionales bacterium]|nr:Do family serine endopeptidase [Chitinivibrionales bacterium]